MLVIPDSAGVIGAFLSYDISAAGAVSAYTRYVDSINDGLFQAWDFSGGNTGTNTLAPASATYTGGGLMYIAGSGVICPEGTGNIMAGICGMDPFLVPHPYTVPSDVGGGIVGSFGTAPGGPVVNTFTLGRAQFQVPIPEPATGGLVALGLGGLGFIRRRRAL
jgi:hypothetical protein